MKTCITLILCALSISAFSQLDKIHIGDGTNINSAILQIDATDRGVLFSKMSSADRLSIANPATSLVVYDTDTNSFWYFSSSATWKEFTLANNALASKLSDTDGDTYVDVEKNPDEDKIRFTVKNTELLNINKDSVMFLKGNDFLIGNSQNGAGSKFMIKDNKYALRFGSVSGNQWDDTNIGIGSFSAGLNNTASGIYSGAWGENNIASGPYSIAFGKNNIVSGAYGVSWGIGNQAKQINSVCWGNGNIADATRATSWGTLNDATGLNSTAWGNATQAKASGSTSFGVLTLAESLYTTAWGELCYAKGTYSTAFGFFTKSESFAETAIGSYQTTYTPNSVNLFNGNDRAFIIGNGTSHTQRSNALEILKNGNATIWNDYQTIVGNAQTTKIEFRNEYFNSGNDNALSYEFIYNGNTDLFQFYREYQSSGPVFFAAWTKDGKFGVLREPTTHLLEVAGTAVKNTAGNWIANSDRRLKKNIETISDEWALNKVLQMNGVHFEWNDKLTNYDRPEGQQIGFIAQELQKIWPDDIVEDTDGYLMAAYGTFDPLYVEAFKTHNNLIDELENIGQKLEEKTERLSASQKKNFQTCDQLSLIKRTIENNLVHLTSKLSENNN